MKNREKIKQQLHLRKKQRIRKNISGTRERPRLVVARGNRNIAAQLVDDVSQQTLATVSSTATLFKKIREEQKGKLEISRQVGLEIAKAAQNLKVKSVVFDRNGFQYHGRVRMVAEGAREGGLVF